MRRNSFPLSLLLVLSIGLVSIGGCAKGGGGAWGWADEPEPEPATYSLGGTATGLEGEILLLNNGGDELSVSESGTFTFARDFESGENYCVTISVQPESQLCTVTGGEGSVADADVASVQINCVTLPKTGRISVSREGAQANNYSWQSAISGDGRYVAFGSFATNLLDSATFAQYELYVKDRMTGENTLVAVSTSGGQADSEPYEASISSDGRFVAFWSYASTLVAGDLNDATDVFVRDMSTGEISRVSVASDGAEGDSFSDFGSLSADGRYVVFGSMASNLVEGDHNGVMDIFVHDRLTGETTRVSTSSEGVEANANCLYSVISADGRFVAFESEATSLVAGDTNGANDVFLHDRTSGETTRISVSSDGEQGNSVSLGATISADGGFVAFTSNASNLVAGDTNGLEDVFVHATDTGVTERVSVTTVEAQANGHSHKPSISADGRKVAFRSIASNLVDGDANLSSDIFVRDLVTGETTRVSVSDTGAESNGDSGRPSISGDGRFVVFESNAANLVEGDTNGANDIFVRMR